MNKSIKINIAKPCSENWSTMTPTEKGKFCSKCSKQVFDLTMLKDIEVIELLKESPNSICGRAEKSKTNICGRMLLNKIDKPIAINSKKFNSKLYKYLTTVFLFGSTTTLFAIPSSEQTVKFTISNKNNNRIDLKKINTDSIVNIFKGQVFTEIEGFEEPIPGAEVLVKELNLKTETDIDGNFSVIIPTDYANDFLHLSINYPGFENVKVSFHKTDWLNKSIFYLKEDQGYYLIGEVVITNFKKRWWKFWK